MTPTDKLLDRSIKQITADAVLAARAAAGPASRRHRERLLFPMPRRVGWKQRRAAVL
jgi:hypothetical protein